MFREESLGKIKVELFRNVSVHEFYRLKALITLQQVNATAPDATKLSEKIKNLNYQNCDGRVL